MKRNWKPRVLLSIAVAATLLSSYAFAEITRPKETDILYFDEYGNLVGEIFYPCVGRVIRWGVVTDSYQTIEISCVPPNPPTPPGGGCPPECPPPDD